MFLLQKTLKGSRNIQGFALIRAVLLNFEFQFFAGILLLLFASQKCAEDFFIFSKSKWNVVLKFKIISFLKNCHWFAVRIWLFSN